MSAVIGGRQGLGLLAAALCLTACGEPSFNSPAEVAKHLGCTKVKHSPRAETSGSVMCTFQGDHVFVYWFDSDDQENGFKLATKQIGSKGADDPTIVFGNRWAIWCTQTATCEAAKKAMS